MTRHPRRLIRTALINVVVLVVVLIAIFPIFWMVTTSFKPADEALAIPPNVFDFNVTLANFADLFSGAASAQGFAQPVINSVIVAIGATALTIALGLPAAYTLARIRFRGKRFLAMWILSTAMFPPMVSVIPIFLILGKTPLIDTYAVLIIPYAAFNLPLVIWMLRSSIRQIPIDIDEAALVDGASRIRVLATMILPLAAPGIAATAMLSIFLSWNEFLFALTLTRSDARTAPVAINEFTTMFGTQWGHLTAGATVVVAPILVLALLMGRRLIQGLTFGAVK